MPTKGDKQSSPLALAGLLEAEHVFLERLLRQVPGISRRPTRFVITEAMVFSRLWASLITLLLVYTGTVFCWYLAYVDSRIDLDGDDPWKLDNPFTVFDRIVYFIFVIDLFLGFFCSYRDFTHNEVVDLRSCARHYLRTSFIVNLIACWPSELIGTENANESVRVLRMQRASRILRLVKFRAGGSASFSGLARYMTRIGGDFATYIEQFKTMRILNLGLALLWIVHILACGWYLCAGLHEDPSVTWVNRRQVGVTDDGTALYLTDSPPIDCWAQSMYFVVTVFTTVGFGDMSALTNGEILYVVFMMIVGVVVHSIIIGEVIGIVTSSDRVHDFVQSRKELVEAFADHTGLDKATSRALTTWIYASARFWMKQQYAKQDMKELIVGKCMPRDMLGKLPGHLFSGALLSNSFLDSRGLLRMPPRLPLLLALHLARAEYEKGEVVFEKGEYPFNLFLVTAGVFVYTSTSGPPEGKEFDTFAAWAIFPYGSYFGDAEIWRGTARRFTCVCATTSASTLVAQRKEFQELCQEFPEYSRMWLRKALARDLKRRRMGQPKPEEMTLEAAAATIIKRTLRRVIDRRKAGRNRDSKVLSVADSVGQAVTAPVAKAAGSQGMEQRLASMEQKLAELASLIDVRCELPA